MASKDLQKGSAGFLEPSCPDREELFTGLRLTLVDGVMNNPYN